MSEAFLAWSPEPLAGFAAALMLAAARLGFLAGRAADVALLACALVAAAALVAIDAPGGLVLGGHFAFDPFGASARSIIAIGATLAVWTATVGAERDRHDDAVAWAAFFASLGAAMAMTSAAGLWSAWTSLAVVQLASTLFVRGSTAPCRPGDPSAGMLLEGAAASAFALLGAALLFALAGETDFPTLRERLVAIQAAPGGRAVIDTATVLVLVGAGRCAGLVPWHSWNARVATRLSLAAAIWLHAVVPVALASLLVRFLRTTLATVAADGAWQALPGLGWPSVVAAAAVATMAAGSVAALRAEDLRRMVARLAVAQAGFVLGGVATLGDEGVAAAALHAAATVVAVAGALASIDVLERQSGAGGIEVLRGLLRRRHGARWSGLFFAFFLASLAALPPLGGHAGRTAVFVRMIVAGMPLLALGAAAASATGLLCWVRVAATMLDRPGDRADRRHGDTDHRESGHIDAKHSDPGHGDPDHVGVETRLVLATLAVATLALGLGEGVADFARSAVAFCGG